MDEIPLTESFDLSQWLIRFFTQNLAIGEKIMPFSLGTVLLRVGLPLMIGIFILWLVPWALEKALLKAEVNQDSRKKVLSLLRIILRWVLVITLLLFGISLFGDDISSSFSGLFSQFRQPFFEAGETRISLITLILLIPIFYAASWLGGSTKHLMDRHFLNNINLNPSRKFGMSTLTKYVVIVVALLIGLSVIGIDLSSLVVIFSVLGIGLGFGLQNTVANFFSGLVMIFSQPIKEGDFVTVATHIGTVQKVNLLATILLTPTNETLIIPNSQLVNGVVHNHTFDDRWIIQKVPIGVHYNSDLDQVEEILTALAEKNPFLIQGHTPSLRLLEFGPSSINYEVLIPIRDLSIKFESLTWTNKAIWNAFKDAGIEIPYQQVDVHVKG